MIVPKMEVIVTKKCKVCSLLRREGKLLCPLGSPIMLGPDKCRIVVLPHRVEGMGVRVVVDVSQILEVLVSVL